MSLINARIPMILHLRFFISTTLLLLQRTSHAFVSPGHKCQTKQWQEPISSHLLFAKPKRLQENVEGVLYVNDKCINCAACSAFAPESFSRSGTGGPYHIVHQQPKTTKEIEHARAALAACPVAAIRVESLAERRHAATTAAAKEKVESAWTEKDDLLLTQMSINPKKNGLEKPFPRPFLEDSTTGVYWLGHHNERSFGAIPYLTAAKFKGKAVWIMIDTPRFSKSATDAVLSVTGGLAPDYLFLTHVDDTADHNKWVEEFPQLKRIFHSGDLGRHNWLGDTTLENVEVLLSKPPSDNNNGNDNGLTTYTLDGTILENEDEWKNDKESNVVILHTPGHSPGSITLYKQPCENENDNDDGSTSGILFTGDTYGYTTRDGGHMTGFPRFGNNLSEQAKTLQSLLTNYEWDIIAPGHGHARDYRSNDKITKRSKQKQEMKQALDELMY